MKRRVVVALLSARLSALLAMLLLAGLVPGFAGLSGLCGIARADVWSAQPAGPLSSQALLPWAGAVGLTALPHEDATGSRQIKQRATTLEILLDPQRTRTGLTDDKLFAQRVSHGINRAKRLFLTLGRAISGVPLEEAQHLYKDCTMFQLDPVFLSDPDSFDLNEGGISLSTFTLRFCGWTFTSCHAAWSWGMYARWVRQFSLEPPPG